MSVKRQKGKTSAILMLVLFALTAVILTGCNSAGIEAAKTDEAAIADKEDTNTADRKSIEKLIEEVYIQGVHVNYDVEAMGKGFSPEFIMFVAEKNQVEQVNLDGWTAYIKKMKEKHSKPEENIRYEIPNLDIAKNAAIVRVEIYKGEKHIYTDFLSLYKVDGKWTIVGKIYCNY